MPRPAKNFLTDKLILSDGAMGTYFAQQYGNALTCEQANLQEPERILAIHRAYLAAGATFLRSNTFAAVYQATAPTYPELENLICSGYRIACAAAGADAWVAADIGPLYVDEASDVIGLYERIILVFIAEGADLFLLETFVDPEMVGQIVRLIRKHQPAAVIIASFALSADGLTRTGVDIQAVIRSMEQNDDVDMIGFNCGIGPTHLHELLRTLPETGKPLSLMPNSGYPRMENQRLVFGSSPEYFAQATSELITPRVHLIGGCCGTTPPHIQSLAAAITHRSEAGSAVDLKQADRATNRPAGWSEPVAKPDRPAKSAKPDQPANTSEPDQLPKTSESEQSQSRPFQSDSFQILERSPDYWQKSLEQGRFLTICELDPPRDGDMTKLLISATCLARSGVDAITLADSPLARIRMDPVVAAARIYRETGLTVIPHLSCRDRNVNALRSLLLAAHSEKIRQILAVTGDGIPESDTGFTKPVFNVNSTGLLNLIEQMNLNIFSQSRITTGAAIDLGVRNPDVELKRVMRKMEQGASFLLTQPVFVWTRESLDLLQAVRAAGMKVLLGLMPLISYRNARYMSAEVPGIHIPDILMAQFYPDMDRAEAIRIGISHVVDMAGQVFQAVDGYYLIAPFNRHDIILSLLQDLPFPETHSTFRRLS